MTGHTTDLGGENGPVLALRVMASFAHRLGLQIVGRPGGQSVRKTAGDIFLVVLGLWIAVVPHAEVAGVVAGSTVDRLVAGMFKCPRAAGGVMAVLTS